VDDRPSGDEGSFASCGRRRIDAGERKVASRCLLLAKDESIWWAVADLNRRERDCDADSDEDACGLAAEDYSDAESTSSHDRRRHKRKSLPPESIYFSVLWLHPTPNSQEEN
jgi:hypothetical protein